MQEVLRRAVPFLSQEGAVEARLAGGKAPGRVAGDKVTDGGGGGGSRSHWPSLWFCLSLNEMGICSVLSRSVT